MIGAIQSGAIFLIVFIAIAALAGCTTVQAVQAPIPPGLLTCRDRPVPGSLELQSDVARYVVDLDAAGQDCRKKVEAVREIVEGDGTPGG